MNVVQITGRLVERSETRFTLTGVEVFEAKLRHHSEQVEAGQTRILDFEFPVLAYGELAHQLNDQALGAELTLKGFWAPRSKRSQRLIVHITDYI